MAALSARLAGRAGVGRGRQRPERSGATPLAHAGRGARGRLRHLLPQRGAAPVVVNAAPRRPRARPSPAPSSLPSPSAGPLRARRATRQADRLHHRASPHEAPGGVPAAAREDAVLRDLRAARRTDERRQRPIHRRARTIGPHGRPDQETLPTSDRHIPLRVLSPSAVAVPALCVTPSLPPPVFCAPSIGGADGGATSTGRYSMSGGGRLSRPRPRPRPRPSPAPRRPPHPPGPCFLDGPHRRSRRPRRGPRRRVRRPRPPAHRCRPTRRAASSGRPPLALRREPRAPSRRGAPDPPTGLGSWCYFGTTVAPTGLTTESAYLTLVACRRVEAGRAGIS